MRHLSPLILLLFSATGFVFQPGCSSSSPKKEKTTAAAIQYQCIPCGYDCDKEVYTEPGKCRSCQMELVKSPAVTFKTIEPAAICDYIGTHPDAVLLDVRTKAEFEGKAEPDFGTLKNAINLPIQEFATKLSSLDSLKNKEIIVFCSHSHRSPRAAYLLTQKGFTHVANLAGGMSAVKDGSCKK